MNIAHRNYATPLPTHQSSNASTNAAFRVKNPNDSSARPAGEQASLHEKAGQSVWQERFDHRSYLPDAGPSLHENGERTAWQERFDHKSILPGENALPRERSFLERRLSRSNTLPGFA